jgi:hypothetical protein
MPHAPIGGQQEHTRPLPEGRSMEIQDVARGLGWASVALGVPQVTMPGRFVRAIGVRDDRESRAWTLAVGAREHLAAAGILALEWPRPVVSLWGRVAGDAMDLALLGAAWRSKRRSTPRLAAATGAVIGIGIADLTTARRMTSDPSAGTTRAAITVWREPDAVARFWTTFWDGDAPAGTPRFSPAPKREGTEIHLEAIEPQIQAKTELLRFKQAMETGEVVRSDGSPEGPRATRLLLQRPAHPLHEGSRA